MSRYSSHEHTEKIRNRPVRSTDLERGILAKMRAAVLDGDTRYYNYLTRMRDGDHRYPAGKRLEVRVIQRRGVNAGLPTVEVGGHRDLTLIELPQTNRLRILWRAGGWWIEVALDAFCRLLMLAQNNVTDPLPALTTVAVRAELVKAQS